MDDRSTLKNFYADYRFANKVPAEPLPWLWPGRIPLGTLTLLVGDPGLGKSLLAADLAARVSAPQPWPDQPNPFPYPAGVVFASPEDSAAETVLPRLAASGANLNHISLLAGVTRKPSYLHVHPSVAALYPPGYRFDDPARAEAAPLRLPDHADHLEQAIRAHDHPRLVVLDPLAALLSPAAQANPAPLLASLGDIAHRKGVAILAIGHLTKGRSHRMLYRLRGSLSFAAAARTVVLLSADPDHPDRRIVTPLKSVYGPLPPPLAFRIASSVDTPHDIRPCENRPREDRFSPVDREILDWRYSYPITPSNSEASNPRHSSPVSPAVAELAKLRSSGPFPPAPHLVWEPCPVPASPDAATDAAPGAASTATALWHRPDLLDLPAETYSALSEACTWLTDYLAAGPRPAQQLLRDARASGIALRTLERAKRILSIRSVRPDPDAGWLWKFPQVCDNQDRQIGGPTP
jgi:hypothetical protein